MFATPSYRNATSGTSFMPRLVLVVASAVTLVSLVAGDDGHDHSEDHTGHDHGDHSDHSDDANLPGGTNSDPADSHDHDHDHDHDEGGTIVAVILFSLAIIAVTLLPVFVPLHKHLSESVIALVRCFSGGVFLSMGLFHLLQHAISELQETDFGNYNNGVPLIVAMGGYLLLLFVEKVVIGGAAHDHLGVAETTKTSTIDVSSSFTNSEGLTYGVKPDVDEVKSDHRSDAPYQQGPAELEAATPASTQPAPGSLTGYVILIALSVHSIFEGIALGIQEDVAGVVAIAVGILAHKWAESLSLSITFHEQGKSRSHNLVALGLFTLVTPIGAGIGLLVSQYSSHTFSAIIQALSAGTFIYIACSERFVKEFEPRQGRWAKFAAVLVGVGLIIGVASFHEH